MRQASKSSKVQLKRVYEPASRTDGTRILVDRLWPRGLSKEDAAIDHWCKELAPSTVLRQWFGHEPERWVEFRKRYRAEIAQQPKALAELRAFARKGPITLVFAARDELHNDAVVIYELLLGKPRATKVPVKTTGKTRRKT
jgi:uncharacterized protein YeaO (DUF488 family)